MPPKTGRVVAGRYRLIESIGRGAMGVVWRATDELLGRDVAVKEVRLNPALGDVERANAYKRTLREARTAARLSHRGLVTIFDVVEEDDRPWIIMELIRSRSLDEILGNQGRLPPRRVARVAQQLLSALAHAHGAGVLHRDVKPSNVLISTNGYDDRAVLTDFGIAQFAGDSRLTQTGMVMGSPGFTAPERIRGGSATPASDLWSLGATIYAACEGQGPYEHRGGAITTMSAIINEDAPQARAAGRLGSVIAALLSRDPARRPSASSAASLIDRILPTLPDAPAARPRTSTTFPPASRPAPPPPAPPTPAVAPTGVDQPRPEPGAGTRGGQDPNSAPPSRTDPPTPAPQPPLATQDSLDGAASGEPASGATGLPAVVEEGSEDPDTAPYDAAADDDGPDTAPYDAAADSDEKESAPVPGSDADPAHQFRPADKLEVVGGEAERKTSRIITAGNDKASNDKASNDKASARAVDKSTVDNAVSGDPAAGSNEAADESATEPGKDSASEADEASATEAGKDSASEAAAGKDPAGRDTADRGTSDRGTADRGTADRGTSDRDSADRDTAGKEAAGEDEGSESRGKADRDSTTEVSADENTAKQDSAKQDSAKQDSARTGSARTGKAKADSVRTDSAKAGSAKRGTGKQDSARQDSAQQDNARQDGASEAAGKESATREESAKEHASAAGAADQEATGSDAASKEAAGSNATGGEAAGQDSTSRKAAVAALAEDKAPGAAVVTSSMETTVLAKPSVGASSSSSPRTAVKAPSSTPVTAATTRAPRPVTADKEPWWASAYQPERRPNQPMPATKPDGRYPLAPTLQQPSARHDPSRAGLPGTSGAGRQSPELTPSYSSAGAGGPGTSGTIRKGSRKVLLLVLALVIIVAAVVVVIVLSEHGGTASASQTTPARATGTIPAVTTSSPALIVAMNDPVSTVPSNFATQAFTPAQTGTSDGFSIAYPESWQVKEQSGSPQRVFFDAPDGGSNVEVDLTPHTKNDMVAEAQYLKAQTQAQGTFPGYKQIRISAENVRGTPGAIWEFYYTNPAGTVMKAEDILFILHTKNGPQSYAILAASPNSVWQSMMLPRVEDMLKTFQPNP